MLQSKAKDRKKGVGISRRQALKGSAAVLSAGLPLASRSRGPTAVSSVTQTPRNIRISLAAYSMRDELIAGEIDLFDFIDWCGEMDLSGVELTSYYFKEGFDRSYLHQLRLRAFHQGISISGTAVGNNLCLPPGSERNQEINHVKRWIDHAAELFAPHIRIFAGEVPPGVAKETAIIWVADSVKEVLEHAVHRGIVLGLENHGGITARATDHLAICRAVGDHPWFGVNLDTGNFRTNPYGELALVAPYAVNVQFKVEVYQPDDSKVPIDFERVRKLFLAAGYKGWIALEYESDGDPRVDIPEYVKKLQYLFRSPRRKE